jgi:hypothetical protein
MFAVDNAEDGFDLYKLHKCSYLRSFTVGKYIVRKPKGVAFAEHGRVLVGGSERSDVYVFDQQNGATLDILRHGREEMMHTIAVS